MAAIASARHEASTRDGPHGINAPQETGLSFTPLLLTCPRS